MRVVVTGAAGRVAPAVCQHLEEAGHHVVRSDLREPRDPRAGFVLADLCQRGEALRLLEGCEVLVHFGNHSSDSPRSAISPAQVYLDNVTMNLLTFDAAAEQGVRQVVFASSVQAISGGPALDEAGVDRPPVPYLPGDGDMPVNPRWYYGLSKAAGEQMLELLCRESKLVSAIAIRFPYLASDGDELEQYRQKLRQRRLQREQEEPEAVPLTPAEVEARDQRRQRHRMRQIGELFTYLRVSHAATLVGAAVERCPAGFHTLFPAAEDTHSGESPADLIAQHYPSVPLRKPIERFAGLVDNDPITELLGWRPSTCEPASAR